MRVGYSGPEIDWRVATNTAVQKQVDIGFVGEDVTLRRLGTGLVEMRVTYLGGSDF